MLNIALRSGEQVVKADDIMTCFDEATQRCEPRNPAPPVIKIERRPEAVFNTHL
jgi:hypothetical protein